MELQAKILDGKKIAAALSDSLMAEIADLRKNGTHLKLATIRVGESSDAELYSRAIQNLLKKLKIECVPYEFPEKTSQSTLIRKIIELNADPGVTAIMVFSPLPNDLNINTVLSNIDISKEVESRLGMLKVGDQRIAAPTACACILLIEEAIRDRQDDLMGKEAVIIGRSDVVGKPASVLLLDRRVTVTVCHTKTKNLPEHVRRADIVIATAGEPQLVKGSWIKPGAIVIDVGENVVGGQLVGDVDFDEVKKVAGYLSPVPGGVGPLTNVALVQNLIKLYYWKKTRDDNR
jgi:methylenetetrahydrofolate dehydrogenase (NADP+)/methenyltetrahydrofolate cyclohydrolase